MSIAQISDMIMYDPSTGLFVWKLTRAGTARKGSIAGYINRRGYVAIKLDNERYFGHNLAWAMAYGWWPKPQADHINRIRNDNRLINLREASYSENAINHSLQKNNKSGVRGVYYDVELHKWRVQISVDKQKLQLGVYSDFEEAVAKRQIAEEILFGEFNPVYKKGG